MSNTLEKIKTLLSKGGIKKTNLYAEAVLDDGRILATEDDKFDVGSEVFVVGDDGETEKVAEGEYTLEDGTKISIDAESKVASLGEEEAETEEEESKEEEMEMPEEWIKTYEEMKKRIEALEKAVYGEDTNVEEMEKEEKVEMSRDMVTSLVEEVEELKSQIVKLEKQPGAEGFKHNPEATNRKKEKVNLGKLSTQERVAYFMSNNNN